MTSRLLCLAALGLALVATPIVACPFCGGQGTTLTGEVNDASMVLVGTLSNAKPDADNFSGGTTDFTLETVLKNHDILKDDKAFKTVNGKKVLTLPRYLPTDKKSDRFLIFCGVFKGKIDPYRGIPIAKDSDIVKYLEGALAAKDKSASDRLRFAFDFLDNPDLEIANDAYKEFANADYKEYEQMAKKLPADKIAGWLTNADTPPFRYGLYGSLLGHCGSEKHAKLLRSLLEDHKKITSGLDGLMAGYTMLQPKEGWQFVQDVLKNPKNEFMYRYAGLRAARFFWNYRPDLVKPDEVVKAVCLLLPQGDIADLAIEDLRKWKRWDVADQVLGLFDKKSHDIPIVRRSILRYALSCQKELPQAATFVADLRKKDPDLVSDAEELLKLETGTN